MKQEKPRIFISYSHKDKEFARMLEASFLARNIETFRDERAITVGDFIPRRIVEGIGSATHLVYIISSASIESRWVEEELNIAKVKEKESRSFKILPLLIEDIEPPSYVKHVRYADFRNWRNPDAYRFSFLEILRAMQIEPLLLGSEELKWYARHRGKLRELSRSLRTIFGELSGALYSEQAVGEDAHYMTTKWVFEKWDVISMLNYLVSELLENSDITYSPRLKSLRDSALEAIQYATKELPDRSSYKDASKIDNFRLLIRTIVAMLDDIEEEVEIALFASVQTD